MIEFLKIYLTPNQKEEEVLEDRNCDGRMELIKIRKHKGPRIGGMPPSRDAASHEGQGPPGAVEPIMMTVKNNMVFYAPSVYIHTEALREQK
jgi:hypothetical protein